MIVTLGVAVASLAATAPATAQTTVVTAPISQGGTVAVPAGKTGKPDKPCPNAGRPAPPSELGPSVPAGTLAAGVKDGAAPGHCRFSYTAVLDVQLPPPPANSSLVAAELRVTVSEVPAPVELAVFATTSEAPQGTVLSETAPSVDSPATATSVSTSGAVVLDALPAVESLLGEGTSALAVSGLPARALFAAPGTAGAPTLELTYEGGGTDDTTAPTVKITAPTFGESVFGDVTVDVDAADDIGVAAVTVTLGGRLVGTDEEAPFSVLVDTSGLPNGEQPLAVEAVDEAGNTARDLIPVVVDNSGGPLRRLDLDYQAGRIDVDTYVLQAMYAVLGQPELDPRYAGQLPDEVSSWTWLVLQHRHLMSADARARLDAMLTPVDEVPAQPAARTAGTVELASTGDVSDPDCSRLRSLLNGGYDCVGQVGEVELWWASEDYSEPKGDVPAEVAEAASGLANAQSYFDARSWQSISGVDAYMAQGVYQGRALSLPYVKEIFLNRDDADLAATAGHELFHQYEYEYLNAIDVLDPRDTLEFQDITWMLEASAEWASHQLVAAYPSDYNDSDKTEYYRNIDLFLEEPQRDLLAWDSSSNRQYGAFPVIEWIEAQDGADSVRELWESIDDSGKVRDELATAISPLGDLMWRDLYMLDIAIPGRVDRVETDRWRGELADNSNDAPYASSGRRPVETSLSLGNGDSASVPVSLGAGGATFIEVAVDLDQRSVIRLSPSMDEGDVAVGAFPLADYDLDPTTAPPTCATPVRDGDDWVIEYDPGTCKGLSIVVSNPDFHGSASGSLNVAVGDRVDTTITNGLIRMGVHAEGHLNVPGYDASSGTGTTTVGLRWMPTNADALAPGCECEGWGIADVDAGVGGWANANWGSGTQDLTLRNAAFDSASGTSEVGAGVGSPFVVEHDFSVARETANLFQVDVTITNNTTALGELLGIYDYGPLTPTYRRVMDWDVEPTAFSEYVTVGAKGGQLPAEVVNATNDGFASPDPREAATDLGARGLFEDFGPDDHGALFDVRLPEIDPGESVTFTLFYGAGATSAMAKDALRLVDAEAWSLAEPDVTDGATTGEPNTFAFGLRFDRPIPALARGLVAEPAPEVEPARNDGQVRQ